MASRTPGEPGGSLTGHAPSGDPPLQERPVGASRVPIPTPERCIRGFHMPNLWQGPLGRQAGEPLASALEPYLEGQRPEDQDLEGRACGPGSGLHVLHQGRQGPAPPDRPRLSEQKVRCLDTYHEYPIGAHLFVDSDWHQHDAGTTTEMLAAITTWLETRSP